MSRSAELNEGLSIADIMRGLIRRRLLIVVPPLLGLTLGALFLLVNKPRYLAEAQVVVENQSTPFDKTVGPQDGSSGGWQVSDRVVSSQVSAMRSEDIASRVVDQLALDTNAEYNANLSPRGLVSSLAIILGFKDDPALYTPKALAAKTLASDLTIYPLPESNVIGIKSISDESTTAAATANALAETYVLSTREVGANSTDRARDWLAKQIDGLRTKMSESDQAVERYRADAGLIRGTTTTLGAQQISELNTQIGIAQNARIEAQAKLDSIQRMLKVRGDVNAAAEVLASPSLQRLKDEQVVAARDITQISATYLPGHPKMIAAQRHLDAVNNQIKIEAGRVVDSLQSQAQVADERAASLRAELEKAKTSQVQAGFSDVRLQALQREAAANRTLLQSMLSRYADANARQDTSVQPGYARVIQKAVAPSASYFPKKGPTMMLAGVAGLLLGLGLAFVAEILAQPALAISGMAISSSARRRLQNTDDTNGAEQTMPRLDIQTSDAHAQAPTHAAVPPATKTKVAEPELAIFGSVPAADSAASASSSLEALASGAPSLLGEHLAKLNQGLEILAQVNEMKVFAYCSLGSHAPNAAMAAIASARALVAKGKKVMLLDLTSRSASVEALLGLGVGPGLSDLVAGKADFTKSVTRDQRSKMHFVRLGAVSGAAQEEAIIARLPAILTALRMVYDMIVINVGEARPAVVQVLANADTTVLLATAPRLAEAAVAAKAIEEAGSTKTLLMLLDFNSANDMPIKATA